MARFIVLEGLDGAGTTTQRHRLASSLTRLGRQVRLTHEPTDRTVGRLIRRILRGEPGMPALDTLPYLFAADRMDHLGQLVVPELHRGTDVISDRYYHSSLAYQSLTLPLEDVWDLNKHFRVPDLTLFVRVGVDTSLERISARGGLREVYEEETRLIRIEAAYNRVLDFLSGLGHPIVEVDGEQGIDQVEAEILEHVRPILD